MPLTAKLFNPLQPIVDLCLAEACAIDQHCCAPPSQWQGSDRRFCQSVVQDCIGNLPPIIVAQTMQRVERGARQVFASMMTNTGGMRATHISTMR